MSSRSCPDWPNLMELAPDLQFMHYTVAEAQLPVDVLTAISHVSLGSVAICCDIEHHVFYAGHTDSEVAEALRGTHLAVADDRLVRRADELEPALAQEHGPLAEPLDLRGIVRDEDDRAAALLELEDLAEALALEGLVSDREDLVEQEHVRIEVRGDG